MSGEEYITAAAAGNENHKGPIAAGGTEQRQRGNIPPAAAATGLFLKLPRCVCTREEKRTVAVARRASASRPRMWPRTDERQKLGAQRR